MDNVDVVRRIEAAYNAQDYDALGGLIASDVVKHTPGAEDLPPGLEGCIAADQKSWQAFPDKRTEIVDIFGDDDRVVSRVHFTGTNEGGMPWMGIDANGRASTSSGCRSPGMVRTARSSRPGRRCRCPRC